MKVAVIGSRSFRDYHRMKQVLDAIQPTRIISGGADGADSLAERYARENSIELILCLPKFKTDKFTPYHPRWFFTRNKEIIDQSDKIFAFWDGRSAGTRHALEYARSQAKAIIIIRF